MKSVQTTSAVTVNARTTSAALTRKASRKTLEFVAREFESYYREQGRQFPWRHERNAYRLAVAEILLQKTRASSVCWKTYEAINSERTYLPRRNWPLLRLARLNPGCGDSAYR